MMEFNVSSSPPVNYYWNISSHWCQGIYCWCRASYVYTTGQQPVGQCNSTHVHTKERGFSKKQTSLQCKHKMWHEGKHAAYLDWETGDILWD